MVNNSGTNCSYQRAPLILKVLQICRIEGCSPLVVATSAFIADSRIGAECSGRLLFHSSRWPDKQRLWEAIGGTRPWGRSSSAIATIRSSIRSQWWCFRTNCESVIQLVTLASASTTLGVLFLTQVVSVDSQNPRRAELVAARLPWLGELVKWKTLFCAVGIALLMLYFALYANAVHHFVLVSDWAAGWLYGDAAERLRPF
jgi:hypothetical protein